MGEFPAPIIPATVTHSLPRTVLIALPYERFV
jgi:hypothetical protein